MWVGSQSGGPVWDVAGGLPVLLVAAVDVHVHICRLMCAICMSVDLSVFEEKGAEY